MAPAKSRFRPHDPDAVHRRFEEIKSRVTRRMDDEWQRLTRSQPRDEAPDEEPVATRRVPVRKRA
jgi:hypothetical protein